MPEGPEVRTLVDQLQNGIGKRLVDIQFLSGRYISKDKRPDGFYEFAKTMTPYYHHKNDQNIRPQATSQSIPRRNQTATGSNENNLSVDTIVEWNAKGKFIYILLDDGKRRLNNNGDEDDEDDFQRSM